MAEQRFDVCYGEHGPYIEPHFCRSWDENGGCYGTNPDHGFSMEEAAKEMAEWHEEQAKMWRDGSHPDQKYYSTGES